tara:strand:- start:740 stop:907 length:168 start_codon:yes stop_codon:yes gene_type:complete
MKKNILTEKQIERLQIRLYKVRCAIGHWEGQKRQAEHYLKERLEEQTKIEKQLAN